jgi:hypothetical protein
LDCGLNSITSSNSTSNCKLQNSTLFTSSGKNLFGNSEAIDNCVASMNAMAKPKALINTDPKLDALSDVNSGFSFGHELRPGSPAINSGDEFICNEPLSSQFVLPLSNTGGNFSGFTIFGFGVPFSYRTLNLLNQTDQRAREYDKTCDLGALEYKDFTILFTIPIPGKVVVTVPL